MLARGCDRCGHSDQGSRTDLELRRPTRFSLPSPRPYPIGLQSPGSQSYLRPSSRVPGMQGAKPIRSLPLDAQAVAARQSNLAVNSSQDSTLCVSTRGNLGVNNLARGRESFGPGAAPLRTGKRPSG